MNDKKKLISVIMGFYNSETTLSRAIDSIIAQTYDNWELIMCDDGSTDSSYQIAESYKNRFPEKIKLLRNEKNMHLAHALNRCIEVAQGEYIARMDADDESLPERFEKQVFYLEANPEYILCGTSIICVNEMIDRKIASKVRLIPDKYTLYKHTPFNHATILCRCSMFEKLSGYTESKTTVRCEDKELWYRFFAADLKGYNLQESLYKVYLNEGSIYRRTIRSRWNIFLTNIRGYKKLDYPWYWYYRPFLNLCKVIIPRKALIILNHIYHKDK